MIQIPSLLCVILVLSLDLRETFSYDIKRARLMEEPKPLLDILILKDKVQCLL